MKILDCRWSAPCVWDEMFDGVAVYPEYLTDVNALICPSNSKGSNALETFDQGQTGYSKWVDIPGFSKNGKVEPCEIHADPYHYYGVGLHRRYVPYRD